MPYLHLQVRDGQDDIWQTLNTSPHDGTQASRLSAFTELRQLRTEWEFNTDLRGCQFRYWDDSRRDGASSLKP